MSDGHRSWIDDRCAAPSRLRGGCSTETRRVCELSASAALESLVNVAPEWLVTQVAKRHAEGVDGSEEVLLLADKGHGTVPQIR